MFWGAGGGREAFPQPVVGCPSSALGSCLLVCFAVCFCPRLFLDVVMKGQVVVGELKVCLGKWGPQLVLGSVAARLPSSGLHTHRCILHADDSLTLLGTVPAGQRAGGEGPVASMFPV